MPDNNIKKTMDVIDRKNIKPLPRSYFFYKNLIVWTLFAVSLIVISLILTIIIFLISNNDWGAYKYLNIGFAQFLIASIPYLWVALLVLVLILLNLTFRKTKEGYKCETCVALSTGGTLVIILALVMIFSGLGKEIHENILSKSPMYRNLIYDKYDIWENPAKGLLGGQITNVKNTNDFTIKDFNGKTWQVKSPVDFSVASGETIKMIGTAQPTNIFTANTITPW